ncbi:hypothetical protein GSI_14423 [Ganoderma sinense ZZ0214-1]|uniref:F-box domain-containing protein n=1 Tax=Ganoderma sinense ZZ0214-1 TaxID=1077348 RepID=A0A2G8RNL9_9APHY|nr:hypothetical protein GSI_14423 [Ganoderma sinense ZZ0214-1]
MSKLGLRFDCSVSQAVCEVYQPLLFRESMQAAALRLGDLPIDVFRSILSTLDPDDDKPTLSACALLSRTCSDVARPILFNTVDIYSHELAQIADFIDGHLDIAMWIKKLRFRRRMILEVLDLTMLISVLSHLPAVRDLHFDMLILTNFPATSMPDRPIGVRKLLVSFLLSDADTIPYPYPALLSLFSPETLEIADSHNSSGEVVPPDYTPLHRPIRRLVLGYGATTAGDFAFLRAVMLPGHLQSFTAQLYGWLSIRNACAFIRDAAAGLTEVDLDACLLLQRDQLILSRIPALDSDEPDWGVLGKALCECSQLESVRIRVPPSRTRRVNDRTHINFEARYTIFAGILCTGHSGPSTLRRVIVRIDSTFVGSSTQKLEDGVELWDLSVLDRILSKDKFPRLDTVTVEIAVPRERDPEGIGKEVRKVLPNLGSAGLLQIVDLS